MGLETTGKLHALFETEQKTERLRLREFVIELGDNPSYPQFVKFQLTGNRCENLDGFQAGEEVRIEFSLRGREWTSPQGDVRYFNSLDVWKIERVGAAAQAISVRDTLGARCSSGAINEKRHRARSASGMVCFLHALDDTDRRRPRTRRIIYL